MLDVTSESFPPGARGTIVLRSVFHTLAYSDVFDYPLTADEVYCYLTSMSASLEEVTRALGNADLFVQVGEYFALRGREGIVQVRRCRAEVAKTLWPKAARYGRIIARLPFVRMVAITGSLAMNNTEEGNDIDYMIVTDPGRLWLCRALTLLVARMARLDGVSLCPNYLITTRALELKERSLYVAHELAQMIPLSGLDVYQQIRRLNIWINDYLPNASRPPALPGPLQALPGQSVLQHVMEIFLRLPFVDWIEKWEMNRKIARLRHEQSASFESYFSAEVCKGHIDRHGQKTESAIREKLKHMVVEP